MQFSVLGPLEVRAEGAELRVGGSRRCALVLRLLVGANLVVTSDRLIADVWDAEPTAARIATLQSHVSQLRRVLGASRLRTVNGGYVLSLAPGDLDATAFEADVADGQDALRRGEPATAADRLAGALRRWRGDAYQDVNGAPWATPEAARLEELRLVAHESRMEAELALGAYGDVIGAAEWAIAQHPLRERLWGQLILALYRDDRQAEALAAYRRLRGRLADELGVDPSPELQALERSILAHDPALQRQPASRLRPGPARSPVEPLPTNVGHRERFVGRTAELDRLRTWRMAAAAAQPRIALVSGEAGIGKTALCSCVAREATADGWRVLHGRCDDGIVMPYRPWVEALGQLAGQLPAELLAAHVAQFGSEAGPLVPALARRVGPLPPPRSSDPDTQRYLLLTAAVGLLSAATRVGPVLLVLDDLHWADQASLVLLRHLAAELRDERLLVLGTFRDAGLAPGAPLAATLAALHREVAVERVGLRGLEEEEVGELIRMSSDIAESDVLARKLWAETDGNPFFVTQILRDAHPAALLPALVQVGTPVAIREVIADQVASLGATVQQSLEAAAVLGVEFDLGLLAATMRSDEEELTAALDVAVAARLVDNVDATTFAFRHVLVQHTLYGLVAPARRARLHKRVADELRARASDAQRVADIAHHLVLGAPGTPETVTALRGMAEAAMAAYAYEEAIDGYEQALDHLQRAADDLALRGELLLGLGVAQHSAGRREGVETLLAAAAIARALSHGDLLGRAALAVIGYEAIAPSFRPVAFALLQEALALLGDDVSALRVALLDRFAAALIVIAAPAEVEAASRTAMALAEQVGGPAVEALACSARLHALSGPPAARERRAVARRLGALAASLHDDELTLFALRQESAALLELGDVAGSRRVTAAFEEAARQAPTSQARVFGAQHQLMLALAEGRFDAVEQQLRVVANLLRPAGDIVVLGTQTMFGTPLRWFQGRLDELAGDTATVCSLLPPVHAEPALLFVEAETGHLDEARKRLHAFLEEPGLDAMPENAMWPHAAFRLAMVCTRLGDADAAERVGKLLSPFAGMVCAYLNFIYYGSYDHHLGTLAAVRGEWDVARNHLEAALTQHQAWGARPWVALTAHALAEALQHVTPGAGERASRLNALARGEADALGLSPALVPRPGVA